MTYETTNLFYFVFTSLYLYNFTRLYMNNSQFHFLIAVFENVIRQLIKKDIFINGTLFIYRPLALVLVNFVCCMTSRYLNRTHMLLCTTILAHDHFPAVIILSAPLGMQYFVTPWASFNVVFGILGGKQICRLRYLSGKRLFWQCIRLTDANNSVW